MRWLSALLGLFFMFVSGPTFGGDSPECAIGYPADTWHQSVLEQNAEAVSEVLPLATASIFMARWNQMPPATDFVVDKITVYRTPNNPKVLLAMEIDGCVVVAEPIPIPIFLMMISPPEEKGDRI